MKIRIIALVVGMVLLLFSSLFTQAPDTLWTRTYGGAESECGNSVQQTSDGGYIITGYAITPSHAHQLYLIRTDSLGDTIWTKKYGGYDTEIGNSVIQTNDEGYVAVGYTTSYGSGFRDFYILRTNSLGNILWERIYGGEFGDAAYSVQQTSDGGYIITGNTASFGNGSYDIWLMKTDPFGDTLWTKTFGGSEQDEGRRVRETSDGGYIVAGWTKSYGAGYEDVYLIKTDSHGDTIWTRTYGGMLLEQGYSVQETFDNGYIIFGSTDTVGIANRDFYLVKTNSQGDEIFLKNYGGSSWDYGYSGIQTRDSGFVMAGCTQSFGAGSVDIWLIKTSSNGEILWEKTFGDTGIDQGYCVQNTKDKGYIIVGGTYSYGSGLKDVYLIKTEPDVGIEESEKGIHKYKSKIQLNVAPNPFTTITRIELLGVRKNSKANLTIYDASGRLVKSVKLETSTFQLGTDLKAGIYFLKLNGKPVGKAVKVR